MVTRNKHRSIAVLAVIAVIVGSLSVAPAPAAADPGIAQATCTQHRAVIDFHGWVALPTDSGGNDTCLLGRGNVGPGVFVLQGALSRCFSPIATDAIYGSETENHVRFLQFLSGIPADGVYGPVTRDHMLWPHYTASNFATFIGCFGLSF